MSEIRDRVIEQLYAKLKAFETMLSNSEIAEFLDKEAMMQSGIEQILSIPELAVVDREAELPKNPYLSRGMMKSYQYSGYEKAQQDMLKAGWVKEIKNET